jgi:hypothetical protein
MLHCCSYRVTRDSAPLMQSGRYPTIIQLPSYPTQKSLLLISPPRTNPAAGIPPLTTIIARMHPAPTRHVQATLDLFHQIPTVRALLPLLAICQPKQLLSIDVCRANGAWMLATFARGAGICATARTRGSVGLDIRRGDKGSARGIGTVCRVRGCAFEKHVSVRGNECATGQEAGYGVNGDWGATTLEWFLLF